LAERGFWVDIGDGDRIIVIAAYGAIAFRRSGRYNLSKDPEPSTMSSPLNSRKVHLVGSRIRELRKGRRLTQTELSEKIGVAQSDLSRMEQGEYKVGLDTLFKILQVFDLNMSEFFGESPEPDAATSRELVSDFAALSAEGQREVRDFVRFKKLQEQDRAAEPAPENAAEKPVDETPQPPPGEENP